MNKDLLYQHIDKVRLLVKVAERGSMRAASRELRLSQPALSRSMRLLEEAIEAPLFRRLPSGIRLTDEGTVVLQLGQDLARLVDRCEDECRRRERRLEGKLRLGAYESLATYFLPRVLDEFGRRHPGVGLTLETDSSPRLQAALGRGDLDAVFSVEPRRAPRISSDCLYRDRFALFARARAGGGAGAGVSPQAALIYSPSALATTRTPLSTALQGIERPANLLESASFDAILALTSQGIGIGILPLNVAAAAVATGVIERVRSRGRELPDFGEHRICVSYPARAASEPLLAAFVAAARARAS